MKKNKNSLFVLCILSLVIYCTLPLLIPFSKNISSWIVYSFTILSIIINTILTLNAGENTKQVLYRVSLIKTSVYYFLLQLVLSIIIFILDAIIKIDYWISLVINILCLFWFIINIVLILFQKRNIEYVETKNENRCENFNKIKELIEIIIVYSKSKIKDKLINIKENLIYSTPISNEKSIVVEINLINILETLKNNFENFTEEEIEEKIYDIEKYILERNILLKSK